MVIRKSSVVMALFMSFFVIIPTLHSSDAGTNDAAQVVQDARNTYRNTTDHIVGVFSDMLYPLKKCWETVVDTLSPHHPVVKDIKNAADYIGEKVPVIAQEIIQNMQTKAHEINDYILQEAEKTAHRVADYASTVITDSATRALDHTQATIETSVHNATKDTIAQVKDAHQEILVSTDIAVQATVDRAMQTVHTSLSNAGQSMGIAIGHEITKELKSAADTISDSIAQKVSSNTRKNSILIAKICTLSSAGLSGLGVALMGTYRYMQHNNTHDLGFVGAGLALTAACYKALDAIS